MTATAEMIAKVRRWTNEPTTTTYSDDDIAAIIESYPHTDILGQEWQLLYPPSSVSTPPLFIINPNWQPTYDLHAAAAEIWQDKLAKVAGDSIDFRTADGMQLMQSQIAANYQRQANYHTARRKPRCVKVKPYTGREERVGYIANAWEIA